MNQSLILRTRYAGVALENPIIVGACGKTENAQGVAEIAKVGAAAVVMKTVFEDPKQQAALVRPWELLCCGTKEYGAHTLYSCEPSIHTLETYTAELRQASELVEIPVIASISCSNLSSWQTYAACCAAAGAKIIELNVSCPIDHGGSQLITSPDHLAKVVSSVKAVVEVPIAVKLSPQTASPTVLAAAAADNGASAVVLLNKFAGLDIDIDREAPVLHSALSAVTGPWFGHIVRRWVAETCANVPIDVCATGGVCSGCDVIKYLLCGAKCVQVAGLLYKENQRVIQTLLQEVRNWMKLKMYSDAAAFNGKALKNVALCEISRDQWEETQARRIGAAVV